MVSDFIGATHRNDKTNPLPATQNGLKASFSDHKAIGLQNDLNNHSSNNLLNSGRLPSGSQGPSSSDNLLSSYHRVLCSECESKYLQSSEGATSLQSNLKVSQLLNNVASIPEPQKMDQARQ